jgi:sugar/nucleoside kinase (ribokinase family)
VCDPADLWPCLPHVDFFFCNAREAHQLTGEDDPVEAARTLRLRGAWAVVLKLGAEGCWVESEDLSERVPGLPAEVVDTTGAGDAFVAGFIASMMRENDLLGACRAGNAAGARMVSGFGAVYAWFQEPI